MALATSPISKTSEFRLEEATIAGIPGRLRRGLAHVRSARDCVSRAHPRLRDGVPRLNSITTVSVKALDDAAALDATRRRGNALRPLHCVPVLLKDDIDTAGMPTTNGSVILKDAVPPQDAPIVRALTAAGALILGKASMGGVRRRQLQHDRRPDAHPYHACSTC